MREHVFTSWRQPSLRVSCADLCGLERYLRAGRRAATDTCPYSLTDVFGEHDHLLNVPHQKGVRWLTEIFSRSANKFPHLTALQIPHTGESLTFAELDARAERMAAALSPFLTGPDQVVAVAMSQDNWQIVASHLRHPESRRHLDVSRHGAARCADRPHAERRPASGHADPRARTSFGDCQRSMY